MAKRRVFRRTRSLFPPRPFQCPKCGKYAIKVSLDKEEGVGYGKCGVCGLVAQAPLEELYHAVPPFRTIEEIDFYCIKIVDAFYQAEIVVSADYFG